MFYKQNIKHLYVYIYIINWFYISKIHSSFYYKWVYKVAMDIWFNQNEPNQPNQKFPVFGFTSGLVTIRISRIKNLIGFWFSSDWHV